MGNRVDVGRGEMIRTSDPLHPMQVRYQAALRPDRNHGVYLEWAFEALSADRRALSEDEECSAALDAFLDRWQKKGLLYDQMTAF